MAREGGRCWRTSLSGRSAPSPRSRPRAQQPWIHGRRGQALPTARRPPASVGLGQHCGPDSGEEQLTKPTSASRSSTSSSSRTARSSLPLSSTPSTHKAREKELQAPYTCERPVDAPALRAFGLILLGLERAVRPRVEPRLVELVHTDVCERERSEGGSALCRGSVRDEEGRREERGRKRERDAQPSSPPMA